MVEKHLYLWKSPTAVIGEIVRDRFGEQQRYEHLFIHMDLLLDLFSA